MHHAPGPGKKSGGEMIMPATPEGGLLWLKTEYHLSDAEYERIRDMHEGYLPGCEERCREIARVREPWRTSGTTCPGHGLPEKRKTGRSPKLPAWCPMIAGTTGHGAH